MTPIRGGVLPHTPHLSGTVWLADGHQLGSWGAPAYPGGVPHCGRTTRSGRRNTAARLPLAPAYPGGVPHCGRTTRSRRQRANEAARAGRPEGPAASPRGRRQPLCHHGGHSRAALDTAPNALHPFGGRNAHNCGAAAEGHHDANKYIYNPTLTHNQPSQPVDGGPFIRTYALTHFAYLMYWQ